MANIEDLLFTNSKILDIVVKYRLEYEQSFNRVSKRIFGITPGKFRKRGKIAKINSRGKK